MQSLDLPFHAAPDELVDWVREWTTHASVYLVAQRFPPISYRAISRDEIAETVADPSAGEILFLTRPFDSSIKYQSDFCDAYSDQLILRVGHLSSAGLGESWLAFKTDNLEAVNLWRQMAKSLRANTKAGVTAINQQTGDAAFYKRHRYSEGAQALESQGIVILPLQGPSGPQLRFGDLTDTTAE